MCPFLCVRNWEKIMFYSEKLCTCPTEWFLEMRGNGKVDVNERWRNKEKKKHLENGTHRYILTLVKVVSVT